MLHLYLLRQFFSLQLLSAPIGHARRLSLSSFKSQPLYRAEAWAIAVRRWPLGKNMSTVPPRVRALRLVAAITAVVAARTVTANGRESSRLDQFWCATRVKISDCSTIERAEREARAILAGPRSSTRRPTKPPQLQSFGRTRYAPGVFAQPRFAPTRPYRDSRVRLAAHVHGRGSSSCRMACR